MRRRTFLSVAGAAIGAARSSFAQRTRRFDPTNFIVLGEGLAAGMGDFGLHTVYQERSFPAVMTSKMKVLFPQPLLEAPGLGEIPGTPSLPVLAPGPLQTTVRTQFPPSVFVFNLSVPGLTVLDALHRSPVPPLVHTDPKQTAINFILGFTGMLLGSDKPLWTQVRYAEMLNPSCAVIALGYSDVLDAAASGDPGRLPSVADFRSAYSQIISRLQARFATILIVNIPDPMDTAWVTTPDAAANRMNLSADDVKSTWGLGNGDLLTIPGLTEIGAQVEADEVLPLTPAFIIRSVAAAEIRARVAELNAEIAAQASRAGALLYDVAALFRRVRVGGLVANGKTLTADYLGGFYLLNGFYPGFTGHAIIANEFLGLINRTFGTSYASVDVNEAAAADPAVRISGVGTF